MIQMAFNGDSLNGKSSFFTIKVYKPVIGGIPKRLTLSLDFLDSKFTEIFLHPNLIQIPYLKITKLLFPPLI